MSEINMFGFMIMILGIILALLSVYVASSLMFTAGILFGVGLSNLKQGEKK